MSEDMDVPTIPSRDAPCLAPDAVDSAGGHLSIFVCSTYKVRASLTPSQFARSGRNMADATAATPIESPPEKVVVAAPAPRPDVSGGLARQLFDQEVADLEAQASVRSFIGVIATRRVKERLRKLAKTE